jgi:hypothetical protein
MLVEFMVASSCRVVGLRVYATRVLSSCHVICHHIVCCQDHHLSSCLGLFYIFYRFEDQFVPMFFFIIVLLLKKRKKGRKNRRKEKKEESEF